MCSGRGSELAFPSRTHEHALFYNLTASEKARPLGIGSLSRHIFLCADQTNPRCAPREITNVSWDHLKKRLTEYGLLQGENCVYRTKVKSLRICEQGSIAVVYRMDSGIIPQRPKSWSDLSRST